MKKIIRVAFPLFVVAIGLNTSPNATAQLLEGDDLILTDGTPGIAFDDTDDVGGWNWTVRGRAEWFRIYDETSNRVYLKIDPTRSSVALGRDATSGGLSSTALGRTASSAGAYSIALGSTANSAGDSSAALGRSASSAGDDSIALGYYAVSGGSSSTALGYFASSAGDSSTALGHVASSVGIDSTALGSRAFAPNDFTMVLGSIPGVNSAANYIDVANGTTDPLAPLHIFRDNGSAQVLVEETSMDAVPRTLFRLASAGSNVKFEIDNTMAGVNWAFTNSGADFRISRQGSGFVEFSVDNDGNAVVHKDLFVGGNVIGNLNLLSDRNIKQNVQAIDPQTILDKVAALPVSAWEYINSPGETHIGPMAQDFREAFALGSGDTSISVIDAAGVALASIKALNEKLDTQNRVLEQRNRQLETRLAKLESVEGQVADLRALVVQLLPQVAQN